MSEHEPSIIERNVEMMHIWLKELSRELGDDDAVRLPRPARGAACAAGPAHRGRGRQVRRPAADLHPRRLLRGLGPEPHSAAIHDVDAFLDRVAHEGRMAGETEASLAATAVARVLRSHVSPGEIDELLAVLPDRFRVLIGA
jgi:hypothetical protein